MESSPTDVVPAPNLFTYAPWLPVLTRTVVAGDPTLIASFSNVVSQQAQTLKGQGQQLTKTAEDTKSFWSGGAAGDTFDAAFQVGTAVGDHAGQVGHYASSSLKLANDFRRLINVVNTGQKMADGVVAALSKIPYVGHGLAAAYAVKTSIWTGLCAAQCVNIGYDVVNLVSGLETKSVQKAYTPPTVAAAPPPTTLAFNKTPAVTVFQNTKGAGA